MRRRTVGSLTFLVARLLRDLCALTALIAAGCSQQQPEGVTLATTTSTQDSGLLDVLVPLFTERTGIKVKVVAVGTGQALQLGRRGDADVLLVHDRSAEDRFLGEGHGSIRRDVMYNDFVLVGPKADAARVKGEKSIAGAFARIAEVGCAFVSRDDDSGTHRKERDIWRRAGVEPRGGWYTRAGAGMGQVLRMAGELRAYTLSDRATFLAQRRGLDLVVLLEGDPLLRNPYGVIAVNPERHPHVRHRSARKFVEFLMSPEAQATIAKFGSDKYGRPLFYTYDATHPAPGDKPHPDGGRSP